MSSFINNNNNNTNINTNNNNTNTNISFCDFIRSLLIDIELELSLVEFNQMKTLESNFNDYYLRDFISSGGYGAVMSGIYLSIYLSNYLYIYLTIYLTI
jgi:hypothetical protein